MRTTAKDAADCNDIRRVLKDIDPLFDIDFNFDTESYTIYFNGYFFRTVPYGEFTADTAQDIRKVLWTNTNGDIMREVEENNEQIEKRTERERSDLAYNLAKDIQKPLLKELRGA